MPKKSTASRVVRKKATEIKPASAADLDRLRGAMDGPIDTSEIPEKRGGFHRLKRDTEGQLPKRRSLIRDAIKRELASRKMTPYRLWKEAMNYCPSISQSAVYDFINGERQLELPYAEALLAAVNLGVSRQESPETVLRKKG
jgi:hypothetical protein